MSLSVKPAPYNSIKNHEKTYAKKSSLTKGRKTSTPSVSSQSTYTETRHGHSTILWHRDLASIVMWRQIFHEFYQPHVRGTWNVSTLLTRAYNRKFGTLFNAISTNIRRILRDCFFLCFMSRFRYAGVSRVPPDPLPTVERWCTLSSPDSAASGCRSWSTRTREDNDFRIAFHLSSRLYSPSVRRSQPWHMTEVGSSSAAQHALLRMPPWSAWTPRSSLARCPWRAQKATRVAALCFSTQYGTLWSRASSGWSPVYLVCLRYAQAHAVAVNRWCAEPAHAPEGSRAGRRIAPGDPIERVSQRRRSLRARRWRVIGWMHPVQRIKSELQTLFRTSRLAGSLWEPMPWEPSRFCRDPFCRWVHRD